MSLLSRILSVLGILFSISMVWLFSTTWLVSDRPGYEENKLLVVVTTSMIGDAVKHIAKDKVEVIILMEPGVDPHAYEATPKDGDMLGQADLIFCNGLHLEGQMSYIFLAIANEEKRLSLKDRKFYAVSEALLSGDILKGDLEGAESEDPHIWHDVLLWKKVVCYINTQLQHKDPINAHFYEANTVAYLTELEALHEEMQDAIAQIPPSKRILITPHDAFEYLGKRYDLKVRALKGFSTVSTIGLRDREALKRFIILNDIKVIFTDIFVNDKAIQAVIESCKSESHPVFASAKLYSDSLGTKGSVAETYIGMMRKNKETIVKALQKDHERKNPDPRNT